MASPFFGLLVWVGEFQEDVGMARLVERTPADEVAVAEFVEVGENPSPGRAQHDHGVESAEPSAHLGTRQAAFEQAPEEHGGPLPAADAPVEWVGKT